MPNEYEQPVEPMSRTEDLLRTGTEEPVIAMSEIEKILRGEHIDRPHSRVADLLLQYNPSDILIEKRIEENGTYYATADAADGYYKVVVDTPVIPPTVLEHLVETVSTNGTHTFTPGTGVDGFSDASITVNVAPNVGSKNITQNGNYVASSDNLDGYSNVNVNVAPNVGSKNIIENGTYNASSDNLDGYSQVVVDVPPEPITEARSVENLPQPIASFSNGAEAPITSLKVAIEPVQDLHGYDSPWVGGAGKNKCNINGGTVTSQTSLGRVTLPAGTYIASATVKNNTSISGSIKINAPSTIATGNIPASTGTTRVETNSFTISEPTELIFLVSGNASGYNYYVSQIQIEQGETATSYAPYSNICPISGWSEVDIANNNGNWWDEEYQIYGSGATARIGNKNPIPCKPNTTYYITKSPSYGWKFYDKAMNVLSTYYNQTYTTPSNCYFMSFQLDESYGTTYNNDVCINTISIDYYTPYNGQTYTIDLDGTRYGGEVDVVNGEGTDRFGYVDLGTLNYTYYSGNLFTAPISDIKPIPNAKLCNALCSIYVAERGNEYASIDGSFVAGFNNAPTLAIHDSRFADATAFKQAMNGVQLVYELATPLTIQLTPTAVKALEDDNNVYANTGNINDLDYIYVNDDVGTLINKSITANGSYCAVTDDNADGYLKVDVNLPDGTNTEY